MPLLHFRDRMRKRARRKAAAFDAAVRARLDARARAAEDLARRFGPEAAVYLGLKARLMWQAGDARRAVEAEDQARHIALRLS